MSARQAAARLRVALRCPAPCFALLVSHSAVAVAVQLQTTAIGRSTVSADEWFTRELKAEACPCAYLFFSSLGGVAAARPGLGLQSFTSLLPFDLPTHRFSRPKKCFLLGLTNGICVYHKLADTRNGTVGAMRSTGLIIFTCSSTYGLLRFSYLWECTGPFVVLCCSLASAANQASEVDTITPLQRVERKSDCPPTLSKFNLKKTFRKSMRDMCASATKRAMSSVSVLWKIWYYFYKYRAELAR